MEKGSERRTAPRKNFSQKISLECRRMAVSQWENIQVEGQGVDVSSTGLGIITGIPIQTGEVVRITLPLKAPDISIPVFSEVCWSRQVDDTYRVGVCFLS